MRTKAIGFFFSILAYCALIGFLHGQDPMDAKKIDAKPTPMVKTLRIALPSGWSKLDLTKEQTAKVYETRRTYQAKIADLNNKLDEARSEERSELIKILTPAQTERLKKLAGF